MKTTNMKYVTPKMEVIYMETEQCLLVQSGSTEDMFEDLEDFTDFFE
ncbi:MAG: hypothetical protein J6S01_09115 [Bacteroidales bacterium]|nr:hypothetical protein [Bacteroidales bacterium]MBR5811005.1 hypothetical protein [Bacteroidales bacterium]